MPPQRQQQPDDLTWRAQRLAATVRGRLGVPADRAALRRGLGQPPEHPSVQGSHAIVAPVLGELYEDRATERAFYTVAALIAAQTREARDDDAPGEPDDTTAQSIDEPMVEQAAEPIDQSNKTESPKRVPNLGATLAYAVDKGKVAEAATEARLHLLCRQDLDGLHRQLPRLIAHLRGEIVPVDWVELLIDLSRWNRPPGLVAKQWLQSYHRDLEAAKNAKTKNTKPQNDNDTPESEDQ